MAEYKGAGDTVTINDVLEVCGKYITNQESIYNLDTYRI